MKAAVLTEYGSNENVHVRDVPDPDVGPEDLLIDVHAASVNPIDWKTRDGAAKRLLSYTLPLTLGSDCSGVVAAVGERVTRFEVGDAVYARPDKWRIGTFAERIAVHQNDVGLKPPSLSHEEAAAVPLAGLTAWQALVDRCNVHDGQRVFIQAGSGGVGTFAIQIARAMGAFVATTCGERNLQLVKDLGADIAIDYRARRFEDEIKDYDIAFDMFGGDMLVRTFEVVRRGGHVVTILGIPDGHTFREYGHPLLALVGELANWKYRRLAKHRGAHYHYLLMRSSGAQLDKLGELINRGKVRPVVDRVFPLEKIREAFAYSEAGHATGKIIIKVR